MASVGLQLLVGLDKNENWVTSMTNYHDEMVKKDTLSYPMIPLLRGKRIRLQAQLSAVKILVVFETQNWEANSIKLTPLQLQVFKAQMPAILNFISAVQKGAAVPVGEPFTQEEGKWLSTSIPFEEELSIKLKWNPEKGFSLVILVQGQKHFTMSAGAFIRFNDFTCTKVTTAIRMWEAMIIAATPNRASLDSNPQEPMDVE